MNWWWANYMGNSWRPKWRLWATADSVLEFKIMKRWLKQSDPVADVEFSEAALAEQRAQIMKRILFASRDTL